MDASVMCVYRMPCGSRSQSLGDADVSGCHHDGDPEFSGALWRFIDFRGSHADNTHTTPHERDYAPAGLHEARLNSCTGSRGEGAAGWVAEFAWIARSRGIHRMEAGFGGSRQI